MAGSMDRCEISTTNSPGTGAGTASLVNSQSPGRGSPDGRAARRTWRLVCGTGITYPERTSVPLKYVYPPPWLTLCRKQDQDRGQGPAGPCQTAAKLPPSCLGRRELS